MLKILSQKWDKNKDLLKKALRKKNDFADNEEVYGYVNERYIWLVRLAFDIIYNTGEEDKVLDINHITQIDNGDYQGTLLFLIPFYVYQPSEYDYLMTYVGYGSCSGCDVLYAISEMKSDEEKIEQYMKLCKDIICNTIKPYNSGWRNDYMLDDEDFDIENLKCVIADISEQNEQLEAKNAELRARLEKAVELPVKVGDTIYCIRNCGTGRYKVEEHTVAEIVFEYDNQMRIKTSYGLFGCEKWTFGLDCFADNAEAEARLKEIKENNNG